MSDSMKSPDSTSSDMPLTGVDAEMEDDEARSEATFRYIINDFKSLKNCVLSPPFYVRNLPWKILVRPRKSRSRDGRQLKSLGFFIQCNGECETANWSCFAVAELRLISHKPDTESFSRKIQHLFYSTENDWGYTHFISWADVLDPEKCYVKDDAITLEVYVKADAPLAETWDPKKHTALVDT